MCLSSRTVIWAYSSPLGCPSEGWHWVEGSQGHKPDTKGSKYKVCFPMEAPWDHILFGRTQTLTRHFHFSTLSTLHSLLCPRCRYFWRNLRDVFSLCLQELKVTDSYSWRTRSVHFLNLNKNLSILSASWGYTEYCSSSEKKDENKSHVIKSPES